MAAINNPRIQYSDVKMYAANKSMPDGVIRFISQNREWTRHYDVTVSLVNNPKTPMDKALSFMNTMRTNDLRQLQTNRNVSQQIARQAKALMSKRLGG
jgi:isochorismate hydrolase